jgi:hypothetical protein
MREWNKPATTLLLGLTLWFFCFCVYLSHLPVNYTYDGMVFASRVEGGNLPLWDYFHPHHLLYTFLGRLIFLWGKSRGATWDGLVTLQFFDIMTGTLGILIAFHLIVRETNDRLIAFLSAAGLSMTYSYWYFSTSPGVRILATVTPLLAWYVLTFSRKMPPLFGALVGLAHVLAVLGHQTNLLLVPAFLGGLWCVPQKTFWERLRASFYYLVVLTAGVLGAYGFVGRYIYYCKTYETWVWWVFSYFHVQQWGGHLQQAGFDRGKFAMVQAFLGKSLDHQAIAESFTFGSAKTIFAYALIGLLGILLLRLKTHWSRNRQALWVSFFWLLAFVPFFIWWEPWNIEFWVSSTVPCWILLGLVASDLSQRWVNPVLHLTNRIAVIGAWAGIVVLLFFYNFRGTVAQPEVNAYGHKALLSALDWKVRKDDLLVLDGINTIPFYIDRYQKRPYFNLHLFLKHYKDLEKAEAEKDKVKKPGVFLTPVPAPDPWKDLSALFQKFWKHHRKVWVLTEVVDEDNDWRQKLEQLMGLPDRQLITFFQQYKLTEVSYHGKTYFYEVEPQAPVPAPTDEPTPAPTEKVQKKKVKKS